MDLPDFLATDVALCQAVGTLPAKPACFTEADKQRETVVDLKNQEMIDGKILQAKASGHDWITLVVDSGISKTFTPHKIDSAELRSSSGSVADGIAAAECSIRNEGVCKFGVAAEESTKTNLRAQACFVPSLGTRNRLLSLQWIKPTDGNCEFRHQPCNFDDFSVTGKIPIKPNTSGWDGFGVMPTHVIETPCHPQPNLPTDKACTSETSSKWTAP